MPDGTQPDFPYTILLEPSDLVTSCSKAMRMLFETTNEHFFSIHEARPEVALLVPRLLILMEETVAVIITAAPDDRKLEAFGELLHSFSESVTSEAGVRAELMGHTVIVSLVEQ